MCLTSHLFLFHLLAPAVTVIMSYGIWNAKIIQQLNWLLEDTACMRCN